MITLIMQKITKQVVSKSILFLFFVTAILSSCYRAEPQSANSPLDGMYKLYFNGEKLHQAWAYADTSYFREYLTFLETTEKLNAKELSNQMARIQNISN